MKNKLMIYLDLSEVMRTNSVTLEDRSAISVTFNRMLVLCF
ncbi:MAG: hypothetical protein ABF649_14530 [Bacillus sp. (in: firmicutes)]